MLPLRRIIALAVFPHCGPSEDALDASTQARGGLTLVLPDWLKDIQDVGEFDGIDRQLADDRESVGLQAGAPLRDMLGASPLTTMGTYICVGALGERLALGRLGTTCLLLGVS